jgi:hypothetical protein
MQINAMQCNAIQYNESGSHGRSAQKSGGDAGIVGLRSLTQMQWKMRCEMEQSRAQRNVNY